MSSLPLLLTALLAAAPATPARKPVRLELFVMSQCPYGIRAEKRLREVVDTLGADVALSIDYVGKVDELASLHGPDEVTADIAQLCAAKLAPTKYLDLIACQNQAPDDAGENWSRCAQTVGIPLEPLQACVTGADGKKLLTESFRRAEARGVDASPTLFIEGQQYAGRGTPTDLLRSVCAAASSSGAAPEACTKVPAAPKVATWILTDRQCAACNVDGLAAALRARISNPELRILDVGDPEGKKLYETLGSEPNLPLVLFDSSLDADADTLEMVSSSLRKVGGGYRAAAVGGRWNPVCAHDGGCALERCKDYPACRKETPGTLDLYVMSQCPYGVRALDAMPKVLKAFGKSMTFRVHYIAEGNAANGFDSLHGPDEVAEDIRQLCAAKLYGKGQKFMDYILCRNRDIRSDAWKTCARRGIADQAMQRCIDSQGKKLLEADLQFARKFEIRSSPTFVVNGKYEFNATDAEGVQEGFCDQNPKLAGCKADMGGHTPREPGSAGGCGG